MPTSIYIVDPSGEECLRLATVLRGTNAEIASFASAHEFLQRTGPATCGCVVSPSDLAGGGIFELLAALRARQPALPVIVLGRDDNLPLAVELMRAGAAEFLEPPVSDRRLRMVVRRALESAAKS